MRIWAKLVIGLAAAAGVAVVGRRMRPAARVAAAGGAGAGAMLLAHLIERGLGSDAAAFLFLSDTHGPASDNASLVSRLLQERPELPLVHGGDVADQSDLWGPWWDRPFAPLLGRRWVAAPGNHDSDSDSASQLASFASRFPGTLPRVEHVGGANLFLLPCSPNASDMAWLVWATAASRAKAKVLVLHRPVWEMFGGHQNLERMMPALERLDLVLAGHEHVYRDVTFTLPSGHQVRQVVVGSGPKQYLCGGSAGCQERRAYVLVEIRGSTVTVTPRWI